MDPEFERLSNALADRYTIDRQIGTGGMASVYLARDLKHDRDVALKVLRPEVAVAVGSERFLYEIKVTARLDHPHIVPLLDSGEAAGVLYYAMPYVEGESLRDRLNREKQLPIEDALRITREVADGLTYAHERGVVHRDIKPENILLSAGHARVADFGIALAVTTAAGDRLTRTGFSVGTPEYMSPEQTASEPDKDGRGDIYSLGCVLYEMLAGEPPFTGHTPQAVLAKHALEPPPSVRSLRPAVPEAVQGAIVQSLAKIPADRYPSATDLAVALMPSDDKPPKRFATSPQRPGSEVSPSATVRRRPWVMMAVLAAILLVAVIGLLRVGARRGSSEMLDPNVVAVLPFDIRGGEDIAYLHEGMVDLLSWTLDDVGELRTVDSKSLLSLVSREFEAPFDPQKGFAVARSFNAGRFVLGTIVASAGRLRIQAALYDQDTSVIANGIADGPADSLSVLVDRITAQILGEQGQGPGARLANVASLTTDSLRALKAFLEGEHAWRAPRDRPKARAAFEEAVRIDSTFALAWWRLAVVEGWTWSVDPAFEYLDRALELDGRLSARDRLRLAGHDAVQRGRPNEAEEVFGTIVRRYPDDSDAWNYLGVVHYFYNWRRGRSFRQGRPYYERALALDPLEVSPYLNLAGIAIAEGSYDEAERLLLLWSGDSILRPQLRAFRAFGEDDGLLQDQVVHALRHSGSPTLENTSHLIGLWTENLVGAHRLAGLLTAQPERPARVRGVGHVIQAHAAAGGGRWSEAMRSLAAAEPLHPSASQIFQAHLAAFPLITGPQEEVGKLQQPLADWEGPDDSPEPGLNRVFRFPSGLLPVLRVYLSGMLAAARGDGAVALGHATELQRISDFGYPESFPGDLALGIRARVARQDGRLGDALTLLEQTRMEALPGQTLFNLGSGFYRMNDERFLRAELLRELGRYEEALRWYDSFDGGGSQTIVYSAPSHLGRAKAHEALGNTEQALQHYERFVTLWRDADTRLLHYVQGARKRMDRLTANTTGQ